MGRGLSPEQIKVLSTLAEIQVQQEKDNIKLHLDTIEKSITDLTNRLSSCRASLQRALNKTPSSPTWELPNGDVMPNPFMTTQEMIDWEIADYNQIIPELEKELAETQRYLIEQQQHPEHPYSRSCHYAYLLHKLHPHLQLLPKFDYTRSYTTPSPSNDKLFVPCPELNSLQSSLRRTIKRLAERGLVVIPYRGMVKLAE